MNLAGNITLSSLRAFFLFLLINIMIRHCSFKYLASCKMFRRSITCTLTVYSVRFPTTTTLCEHDWTFSWLCLDSHSTWLDWKKDCGLGEIFKKSQVTWSIGHVCPRPQSQGPTLTAHHSSCDLCVVQDNDLSSPENNVPWKQGWADRLLSDSSKLQKKHHHSYVVVPWKNNCAWNKSFQSVTSLIHLISVFLQMRWKCKHDFYYMI